MGSIHTRILAFLLAMSVANVCLGVHRDALALTRGAVPQRDEPRCGPLPLAITCDPFGIISTS